MCVFPIEIKVFLIPDSDSGLWTLTVIAKPFPGNRTYSVQGRLSSDPLLLCRWQVSAVRTQLLMPDSCENAFPYIS